MFIDKVLTAIFGTQNDRDVKALQPILAAVNAKEEWAKSLKPEEFPQQTQKFKERLAAGETLDDILPEAFALCREASWRVIGERPFDVQIMGSFFSSILSFFSSFVSLISFFFSSFFS